MPVDDLALYRPALTTAAQADLMQLDRPTRYSMTLTYDADKAKLSGSQDVIFWNRQAVPLNEIYFRLFANYPQSGGQIVVSQVTVNGASVTPSLQVKDTVLRVPLAQPLAPNASAKLHLEFSATLPRVSGAHYDDLIAGDFVATMPTIAPLIPAYDAQGWHIELPPPYGDLVYADVSLYDVTLTVPSNLVVIASGSTVDSRDNGNGTATWKIVGAPMRDFDLNVTSKLQKTSAVVGETTINSYFEPNDAQAGKQALEIAVSAFKLFQNRFGAYPYRELDVVETPTTAGGIEYPGVIVIGRKLYTGRERDYFEFAVAHEVAHQWWYGIVGNDQINFPWVDEALAQYSTLMYYENTKGAPAGANILKSVFQATYNQAKNDGRDLPVNQPVGAFSEREYVAMVYNKGPLFFDAMRKQIGDDKFYNFLRAYFDGYRYKVAFPDDLLKSAEAACACSLRQEYQTWILGPVK